MFGLGQGLLEPGGGFKLCSAAAYDLEILTRLFLSCWNDRHAFQSDLSEMMTF